MEILYIVIPLKEIDKTLTEKKEQEALPPEKRDWYLPLHRSMIYISTTGDVFTEEDKAIEKAQKQTRENRSPYMVVKSVVMYEPILADVELKETKY